MEEYKDVLHAICENLEVAAENAMENHKRNGDIGQFKTAKEMREKYARLGDKIMIQGVSVLDKQNYLDLMVGTFTIIGQLKRRAEQINATIAQYENDFIPKLTEIIKNFEESNN